MKTKRWSDKRTLWAEDAQGRKWRPVQEWRRTYERYEIPDDRCKYRVGMYLRLDGCNQNRNRKRDGAIVKVLARYVTKQGGFKGHGAQVLVIKNDRNPASEGRIWHLHGRNWGTPQIVSKD